MKLWKGILLAISLFLLSKVSYYNFMTFTIRAISSEFTINGLMVYPWVLSAYIYKLIQNLT